MSEQQKLQPGLPVIIGEGISDQAFFSKLAGARELGKFNVFIAHDTKKKTTGNTCFRICLEGLHSATGIDQCPWILVCADNDDSPDESFKKVADQVQAAKWPRPESPRTFTAASDGRPKLAVLMMPQTGKHGALECLLYRAAAAKRRRLSGCVKRFGEEVRVSGRAQQHLSKFQLRCLVAAAHETDPSLSFAYLWSSDRSVPRDMVPLKNRCFDDIADYLRGLGR